MTIFADTIGLTATYYWRLNEASGGAVSTGASAWTLPAGGTPTYQSEAGPITGDANSEGMGFNLLSLNNDRFQDTVPNRKNIFLNASQYTINFWCKFPANTGSIFSCNNSTSDHITCSVRAANELRFWQVSSADGNFTIDINPAAGDFSTWRMVTFVFDAGQIDIYVDDQNVFSNTGYGTTAQNVIMDMVIGNEYSLSFDYEGLLSEFSIHRGTAFDSALVSTLFLDQSPPASLPMSLEGFLTASAASLPMRLIGLTQSAAASVSMLLEGLDSTHFLASSATVDWQVILNNVDISATIFGEIKIIHEENSSSLCSFNIIPAAGAIDLDDYERKEVKIIFVGKDAGGATLYTSRRFTGITSEASYNPDSGIMRIQGTTDLQGRFENLPRQAIDTIIGGSWSEHIFDDAAQGWQYAQDRLSTIPSEVHVTQYGALITVPFAAKATADIELTDDEIEFESFAFSRANRRDIISRVQINMDFRFARLRHREIGVHLVDTFGFCHYLNNGWRLPQRSMIESASNTSGWTRISDITFYGLPVAGTYCTPPRGWVGGADEFCLGAYWTAARRWAQSVTEEYTLIVQSPDIEEAVGEQLLSEDYGIEATYDATDYEQLKDFDSQPAGSSYDSNLQDWKKDATDSEDDGRTVMEAAQEIALDRARVSILSRARLNKLSFSTYFRPDLTLEKTVRVNCTDMVAKGKVYRVVEMLDSDPGNARVSMRVDIALSRHGGSGLGADDPRIAATEPDVPAETPTPRQYYMQYRIGGLASSPPDDPDWDGYMTNVQESVQDPGANLYQTRFSINMPEIEESARNTVSPQAEQSYEIAVPEDELTMSY